MTFRPIEILSLDSHVTFLNHPHVQITVKMVEDIADKDGQQRRSIGPAKTFLLCESDNGIMFTEQVFNTDGSAISIPVEPKLRSAVMALFISYAVRPHQATD